MSYADYDDDCDCLRDGYDPCRPVDMTDEEYEETLLDDATLDKSDVFLYDDGSYEPPETDFGLFEDF